MVLLVMVPVPQEEVQQVHLDQVGPLGVRVEVLVVSSELIQQNKKRALDTKALFFQLIFLFFLEDS